MFEIDRLYCILFFMEHVTSYIQKIHSSLKGQGRSTVRVSSFFDAHAQSRSLLHPHAHTKKSDISALVYSILRLPPEIFVTREIILGQSDRVFTKERINVNAAVWRDTKAIARRRKCRFHRGTKILAVFIASISDVEDLVTMVTALSLEIVKLHKQLQKKNVTLNSCFLPDDWKKLQEALGENMHAFMQCIYNPRDIEITLLAGSHVDYSKAVQQWWIHIAATRKKYHFNVYKQPLYFVSSNSHSLLHLLSGFALKKERVLRQDNAQLLAREREAFQKEQVPRENMLYYLSRFSEMRSMELRKEKEQFEQRHGMVRLPSFNHIDIEAQVIAVRDVVRNTFCDPRIRLTAAMKRKLGKSNALILNIAYPLGLAAYSILREVTENAPEVYGVYIMGKAASLNASVGDITIPDGVFDTHTKNKIFVRNIFESKMFRPFCPKNAIIAQQKTVSVRRTFLQNERSLKEDFHNGYSIVEMEAGPYMNRVFEMLYPERYPENATFVLDADFRLGLAYYVSDTPHQHGVNLGVKRLTWEGLNATYAISIGIVNDIFQTEASRV